MMQLDTDEKFGVVEVVMWLVILAMIALAFVSCDLSLTQGQRQEQGVPCNTCPDETVPEAGVTDCSCAPVVRDGRASSCTAQWSGGPSVCPWEAMRLQDSLPAAGSIQRGGEIDPGPPGQGAGSWLIYICECPVGFEADS